jgi:hypothetical protein
VGGDWTLGFIDLSDSRGGDGGGHVVTAMTVRPPGQDGGAGAARKASFPGSD